MTTHTPTETHTPGPWNWKPRYREDGSMIALLLETEHRPIDWNDPVIFALREDWIGECSRNRGPDMALIASAPTLAADNAQLRTTNAALLAALQAIFNDEGGIEQGGTCYIADQLVQDVYDAIQQAKG